MIQRQPLATDSIQPGQLKLLDTAPICLKVVPLDCWRFGDSVHLVFIHVQHLQHQLKAFPESDKATLRGMLSYCILQDNPLYNKE